MRKMLLPAALVTTATLVYLNICSGFVLGDNRATSQDYTIDTLVVVDDVMYNSWKFYLYPNITDRAGIEWEIKQYVALVVHQANKRLATIKRHESFGLRLQVSSIHINKAVLQYVLASLLTRQINADMALDTFHKWIVKRGNESGYDHAMLLTGRQMSSAYEGSAQGSVAGRAYVGTLCDQTGLSVSVVQDLGGFQSVHFVAHEAAHSLGALHDGEPGAEGCSESNRYLMSAVKQERSSQDGDVSDHPWYFSNCSATSISDVIDRITQSDNNCLNETSIPIPEFASAAAVVPGQVYDATDQCRMLYGPRSRLCLGASFSSVSDICTSMYCSRTSSRCVQHYAAEGTSCGNKMWCHMGQCVESAEAPEMDDCPYGDTALSLGDGASCAEYLSRSPSACYKEEIREACCKSCAELRSKNQLCPYGDRRRGCTPDVCEQVYPNGTLLAELCCGTCNYTAPRLCRDVSSVDGFTCRERVTAYSKQECYNATVAFHCCETCSQQRIDVAGCEYGDLITGGYCEVEARYDFSGCSRSLKSVCCLTCDPESRNKDGDGGGPNGGSQGSQSLLLVIVLFSLTLVLSDAVRISETGF